MLTVTRRRGRPDRIEQIRDFCVVSLALHGFFLSVIVDALIGGRAGVFLAKLARNPTMKGGLALLFTCVLLFGTVLARRICPTASISKAADDLGATGRGYYLGIVIPILTVLLPAMFLLLIRGLAIVGLGRGVILP
jgi:hypothetical protein